MTTSCSLRLASSIDVAGDLDRVADAVAGLGGEDGHADALTVDLELLDGVGSLEVGRDQDRGLVLVLEPQRELGGERGLAGALEAGQHDDGRAGLGVAQPTGLAAEDGDELLVDDLDDLLGRVERPADLFAARALLDRADELLDHGQRDVGLEQRDADLARGRVDVGLGQLALAAQVLEGFGEPVGECGEQVRGSSGRARCRSGRDTRRRGRRPSLTGRRSAVRSSPGNRCRRPRCPGHRADSGPHVGRLGGTRCSDSAPASRSWT